MYIGETLLYLLSLKNPLYTLFIHGHNSYFCSSLNNFEEILIATRKFEDVCWVDILTNNVCTNQAFGSNKLQKKSYTVISSIVRRNLPTNALALLPVLKLFICEASHTKEPVSTICDSARCKLEPKTSRSLSRYTVCSENSLLNNFAYFGNQF